MNQAYQSRLTAVTRPPPEAVSIHPETMVQTSTDWLKQQREGSPPAPALDGTAAKSGGTLKLVKKSSSKPGVKVNLTDTEKAVKATAHTVLYGPEAAAALKKLATAESLSNEEAEGRVEDVVVGGFEERRQPDEEQHLAATGGRLGLHLHAFLAAAATAAAGAVTGVIVFLLQISRVQQPEIR